MALTADNKKRFRTIGHDLKPVVTIAGNGLSEGVLTEINRALEDHELIKIKLAVEDRDTRKAVTEELCEKTRSEIVQTIGKMLLLYREARKPKLKTSNTR